MSESLDDINLFSDFPDEIRIKQLSWEHNFNLGSE